MKSLQISYIATDKLIPYARNSRTHSDEQVAMIAASIKEFGFTNPILVDEEGGIIAGHGRLMAAMRLSMKEVPTILLEGLTTAQKKALVIADNQLATRAGWDIDMLKIELGDLNELDFDTSLLGFDDDFLKMLNAPPAIEGETDPEATPEVPVTPVCVVGDVWALGRHRLVVGDSTSITDVDKLMCGEKADMVFTDPPYNVDYEGKAGKIKNDAMSDSEFDDFLDAVFGCYVAAMKSGAAIYVCHPDRVALAFHKAFVKAFKLSCVLIWIKERFTLGRGDYHSQHEPILYGWPEGAAHSWHGDRKQTTLWTCSRDAAKDYVHPTQKPVELIERAIGNSSKGGDLVLDLFGGSGSTLIAAEKTGRTCRTMELDPKFADVIVERWQNFTKLEATNQDGETFAVCKSERIK